MVSFYDLAHASEKEVKEYFEHEAKREPYDGRGLSEDDIKLMAEKLDLKQLKTSDDVNKLIRRYQLMLVKMDTYYEALEKKVKTKGIPNRKWLRTHAREIRKTHKSINDQIQERIKKLIKFRSGL